MNLGQSVATPTFRERMLRCLLPFCAILSRRTQVRMLSTVSGLALRRQTCAVDAGMAQLTLDRVIAIFDAQHDRAQNKLTGRFLGPNYAAVIARRDGARARLDEVLLPHRSVLLHQAGSAVRSPRMGIGMALLVGFVLLAEGTLTYRAVARLSPDNPMVQLIGAVVVPLLLAFVSKIVGAGITERQKDPKPMNSVVALAAFSGVAIAAAVAIGIFRVHGATTPADQKLTELALSISVQLLFLAFAVWVGAHYAEPVAGWSKADADVVRTERIWREAMAAAAQREASHAMRSAALEAERHEVQGLGTHWFFDALGPIQSRGYSTSGVSPFAAPVAA